MTNNNIAQTIASQLGNAAFALLGAKDLLAYGEGDAEGYIGGLRFRIGKNPQRATHVFIGLTGRDTYDIRISRFVKKTLEDQTVSFFEDVYADQLHSLIEEGTDLLTTF